MRSVSWLIVIIAAVVWVGMRGQSDSRTAPQPAPQKEALPPAAYATDDAGSTVSGPDAYRAMKKVEAETAMNSWTYFSPTDQITGKTYKIAQLRSDNSLSLGFPYRGPNYGTLSVRQHPQYGLDVFVSVEKGQILCRGGDYGRCTFKIRFDDGKAESFTAVTAEDGSTTVIFAAYPKWALEKLKTAKSVTVQMLMYQAGDQVLSFRSDVPLKW